MKYKIFKRYTIIPSEIVDNVFIEIVFHLRKSIVHEGVVLIARRKEDHSKLK
jgi:hypothetical protein